MRKDISLYLPTWPTDRLRRRLGPHAPPPETPLVMVGQDARRRVVTAANAAAQASGIHVGLAATQAHALVPELVAHDAESEEDAAGLGRLAIWALKRYVPIVAADPPAGLMLDATGADHLHGGPEAMLADLLQRLAAIGISARVAMAGFLRRGPCARTVRPVGLPDRARRRRGIGDRSAASLRVAARRGHRRQSQSARLREHRRTRRGRRDRPLRSASDRWSADGSIRLMAGSPNPSIRSRRPS